MSRVWVNSKWLTSDNPKAKRIKAIPVPEVVKVFYSTCPCGESIYEDDWVGMVADHFYVVCYACWRAGVLPIGHLDVVGLKFTDLTLSI